MLQKILGGLFIFGGVLFASAIWLLPMDTFITQLRSQGFDVSPADTNFLRLCYSIYGGILLMLGVALLGMTPFISRGGKWSSRVSIVLCCSIGVVVLFELLASMVQLGSDPIPAILSLMMGGGIFALVTFTVMKLLTALKVSQKIATLQWMHYQQMMQQSLTNYAQTVAAATGYHQMPAQPILPDNPTASPPIYPSQSPPQA